MSIPLKLLILEDQPADAELALRELRQSGFEPLARRVETKADYLAALEAGYAPGQGWDIVLADYQLPQFTGQQALQLLRERGLSVPFILISGAIGEEVAVEAMRWGAADYLMKDRLSRLGQAVMHALDEHRLRQEKQQAEEKYRRLFEDSVAGIYQTTPDGYYLTANPALARMLGYDSPAELTASVNDLARQFYVDPSRRAEFRHWLEDHETISGFESEIYRKNGNTMWVSENARAVRDKHGTLLYYEGITEDITDRKQAVDALRESEQRYRGLFENSPIPLWEEDYSLVEQQLENLRRQGVFDFRAYFASHAKVVAECAGLIRIVDVNKAALNRYKAGSKDELLRNLDRVFGPSIDTKFLEELIKVAEGQKSFEWEGISRSLAGDQIIANLHWSVVPGYEQSLSRVVISAVDITQRKQAEAAMKQHLAELEAVNSISTALRAAQTLDDMLPRLLEEALAILGGSAGSIWFYDPGRDEVQLVYERGCGQTVPPFKSGEGVPGYVVATGQAYLSRELKSDPRTPEAVRGFIPAGRGGACVPIRSGDQIIGVLYLNADLPHEFTPADAHLLTTLAEIAGSAIHRTRLHEQTLQRLSRLTALRTVDRAITGSLDLKLVLQVILEQVTKQLAVDAADVWLLEPATQALTYAVGRGLRAPPPPRASQRIGEGHAGRVALTRSGVEDAGLGRAKPKLGRTGSFGDEGFVSYFGTPLIAKGQVKGVMELFHRETLAPNDEWRSFLEALAGQAAIAIDNATLFQGLERSNTELFLAYEATIDGWSRALDLRDKETEGHSRRVTEMTVALAGAMGMTQAEVLHMRRGALLHDIGKMGVPDGILLKPGPLTDEEWVSMRQHPQFAFDMLVPIDYLRPALDIPYCHHEKWDGTGYPRGLKGDTIPLAARIFAVADVWDALRSTRPYRPAWPENRLREHIRGLSGTHFDPAVVEAFLQLDLGGHG